MLRLRQPTATERAEELELVDDLEGALQERLCALEIEPEHPEMAFWAAIALAGAGRLDEARRTVAIAHAAGRAGPSCCVGWSPTARWS